MAVKLLSESVDATITDEDQLRIDAILAFWFREHELSAPQIDRRMDIWFGEDDVFDLECKKEFADDVERATEGKLDHWAHKPHGRLARGDDFQRLAPALFPFGNRRDHSRPKSGIARRIGVHD